MIKNGQVMDHKRKNFQTYLAILKAIPDTFWGWVQNQKAKSFQRISWINWLYFLLFTKVRVSTVNKSFKKIFFFKLWTYFIDRDQLHQWYRATTTKQFTFYLMSQRVPGTHFVDFERMKAEPTLEPPLVLKPGSEDLP